MIEPLTVEDVVEFAKDSNYGNLSQLIWDAVHIERERCAKVMEDWRPGWESFDEQENRKRRADKIRSGE